MVVEGIKSHHLLINAFAMIGILFPLIFSMVAGQQLYYSDMMVEGCLPCRIYSAGVVWTLMGAWCHNLWVPFVGPPGTDENVPNRVWCSWHDVPRNGCMMPGLCFQWSHQALMEMCPTVCGADEILCPEGMDPNGCKISDLCMPFMGPSGNDGNACQVMCPTMCDPITVGNSCENGTCAQIRQWVSVLSTNLLNVF